MSGYQVNGESPIILDKVILISVDEQFSGQYFLQEDEIGSFGYDSVNHDVTVMKSNDCVKGIAVDIQGKLSYLQ
jgi:hypothetical protein